MKKMYIREKEEEQKFGKWLKNYEGIDSLFLKNTEVNAPDRLILLQGGKTMFIEFKTPAGELTTGQIIYMQMLRSLSIECHVVTSAEEAKEIIIAYEAHYNGLHLEMIAKLCSQKKERIQ